MVKDIHAAADAVNTVAEAMNVDIKKRRERVCLECGADSFLLEL